MSARAHRSPPAAALLPAVFAALLPAAVAALVAVVVVLLGLGGPAGVAGFEPAAAGGFPAGVVPAGAANTTVPAAKTGAAPTLADGTSPADGETVTTAPAQLVLVFAAKLTAAPGVVLQLQQGSTNPLVPTDKVTRGDDAKTWYAPISGSPLAAGTYKVTWTETASKTTGSYQFTVAGATATTPPASASPAAAATTTTVAAGTGTNTATARPETARALGVVARFVLYLSLGSLLGGLVLIAVAWNEGVEYLLTLRYFRLLWFVAAGSALVNVIATRAVTAGESIGSSLSPTTWSALTHDTAGLSVLARFALVLASGWVAWGPERVVDEATQIPALLAPAVAVATFGFTRAHSGLDLVATPAGIVHALAFAVWFGGLVLLWRVVLAGSGERDLVDAVRGFGHLATPALIATVLSGAVLLARFLGGISNFFGTGYGRLLLLKALVVVVMAYAGTINRQTARRRLSRAEVMPARTAARLRRAIQSETMFGVVVLLLTGWMVGSHPPGVTAVTTKQRAAVVQTVPLTNDNYKLLIGIGPERQGLNDITITVVKPATGLVDLQVKLEPIDHYVASIVIPVSAHLTGKGVLVVAGVPLDAPGKWRITASGQSTNGSLGDLSAEITVAPAAADGTTATTAPATGTATTAARATTTAGG